MTGERGSEIAVILLDESGTIVDAHASCAETFGWQRGELVGKDVRELLQYGRDLLMSQLQLFEDEAAGNTSFSVRVLARHKDQRQFPARATVRRFRELECWTVAFYEAESELTDNQVPSAVSPEEIDLAKRALEEGTVQAMQKAKKQKAEEQKGEGMSVSRLWRNSRLLFSARDGKGPDSANEAAEEQEMEEVVARDSAALATQVAQAVTPAPHPAPAPVKAPSVAVASAPPTAPPPPAPPVAPPKPAPVVEHKPPTTLPARHEHSAPAENLPGLARLKAELEKERGERARIEQRCASLSSQVQSLHLQLSENLDLERENSARLFELERDLRESRDAVSQARSDLDAERRERESAEEQLAVIKELNAHLEQNLALSDQRAGSFETAQHELRVQIERAAANLREAEAALQSEREARQNAENSLSAALRQQREFEQKTVTELSIIKSLLETTELEKSRGQEYVLRARAEALETARNARGRLNHFRKSFAQLSEHINGTTSELLQSNLSDEQKYVIEALLQDVISLQSTLEKEEPAVAEPVEN